MPKERPILMSGGMVRASLEDQKGQTRRAVKFHGDIKDFQNVRFSAFHSIWGVDAWIFSTDLPQESGFESVSTGLKRPYGQPGDRLWLREKWAAPHKFDHLPPKLIPADADYHYAATEPLGGLLWRPSIHMPRWASRITLKITGIRVERLQDISEADAKAEGAVEWFWGLNGNQQRDVFCNASVPLDAAEEEPSAHDCFIMLWDSLNFKRAPWTSNPWVWVVEFKSAV